MVERILRRPEVEARTGLSRSTIYAWMELNEFPKPIALGARLVGWTESSIEIWIQARAGKSLDRLQSQAALLAAAKTKKSNR
jgi:prophage regulatory protein